MSWSRFIKMRKKERRDLSLVICKEDATNNNSTFLLLLINGFLSIVSRLNVTGRQVFFPSLPARTTTRGAIMNCLLKNDGLKEEGTGEKKVFR